MAIARKVRAEGAGHTLVAGTVKGGTNTFVRTKGNGFTVSYTSTGILKVTLSNPERYSEMVSHTGSFGADTPGDVKSYQEVFDTYDQATGAIEVHLFESGTLTNLESDEYFSFAFDMRHGSVDAG